MSTKVSVKAVYHINGIYIRFTVNRKSKYQKLFTIEKHYFKNERIVSSHPNYLKLNLIINEALAEWTNKALDLQTGRDKSLVETVVVKEDRSERLLSLAITEYAKHKRELGQYKSYRKYINIQDKVLSFQDCKLSELDKSYWERFMQFLKDDPKINSQYTINRYMQFARTVIGYEFNQSQNIDRSIFNIKVSKGNTIKEKLTKEEFQCIQQACLSNHLSKVRDIFSALVYAWGCRIGDMLQMKPQNIINGRLTYVEQKTGKVKSLKISPELQSIFDRYNGKSPYYLFPYLTEPPANPKKDPAYQKHIESKTTIINDGLKKIMGKCKIDKSISSHCARHTFAIWTSQSDVAVHHIQQMLNHSSKSITENYIKDLVQTEELDKIAEKVLA